MKLFLLLLALGYAQCAPSNRIVGGSDAKSGQFPWQVSLQFDVGGAFAHICGGSLIAEDRVLTAAHCVEGTSASDLRVVLGILRLDHVDETEQILSLSSLVIHPEYDGEADGSPNDFAVLRLSGTANTASSAISIIDMADKGDDFTGEECTLSGWGRLSGGGALPNTLQWVNMKQISNAQCAVDMTDVTGGKIGPGHICVSQADTSACNGDSGGPMVCSGVLAGVASWVVGGCLTNYPSVYGRVSEYRNWIDKI
ncbi:chymotrypsin-like serine proteinase isoform X1 [Patella vulgata]|uniref:chymotrypsin-like serine proteinase isoform X1 n=1 Tax=Patella vulgata TaxID=6465 RepID=UPI002180312E|nr:chymotrypsin-like serine proteinase isoform X1 [Patella vulgata]